MYRLEIPAHLDKLFSKMSKKDPEKLRLIHKKIKKILDNPTHFKPLRAPLQNLRRVHIAKSFVLVYEIEEKIVRLIDFEHHDKIYKHGWKAKK
jgi:mRNA interferase RelE/StbE/toxin YoeB